MSNPKASAAAEGLSTEEREWCDHIRDAGKFDYSLQIIDRLLVVLANHEYDLGACHKLIDDRDATNARLQAVAVAAEKLLRFPHGSKHEISARVALDAALSALRSPAQEGT